MFSDLAETEEQLEKAKRQLAVLENNTRMVKGYWESVGYLIQRVLAVKGMTQKDLAKKIPMDEHYLSKLLNCKEGRHLQPDHLEAIARILGQPVAFFEGDFFLGNFTQEEVDSIFREKERLERIRCNQNEELERVDKYIKNFNESLEKMETPEARDALKTAQLFINTIDVQTDQNNTAFINGLAMILCGVRGGEYPEKLKKASGQKKNKTLGRL
jgi:transcriptional regulator with XRE-family HTH domain